MQCQKCGFEISFEMTHAVKNNICPACGSQIMSSNKMEQYNTLRQVLMQNQLTNNPTAEAKLRERLIALILRHFDLVLVQPISSNEGLIDLDSDSDKENQPVSEQKSQFVKADSSDKSNPRQITREGQQVRDSKQVPTSTGTSLNSLRRQVFESTYSDVADEISLESSTDDLENIDLEEVKQFFPGHEEEVGVELDGGQESDQSRELRQVTSASGKGRIRRV